MKLGIGLGLNRRLAAGGFSPALLFAGSEPGVWLDPSDLTTLFQDTAGTIPVTAAGQTVARINDKSGNNNHATQATAAARPIYQVDGNGRGYLAFDGVDDFLVTPAITPGTDKAQAFAGVRKLSDAGFGTIVEHSADTNSLNGAFSIGVSTNQGDVSRRTWAAALRGTTFNLASAGVFAAPDTRVQTAEFDISQSSASSETRMRLNGASQTLSYTVSDAGTGNFLAYPLYIGRRAGTSLPLNGNIYSLIVRFGANLTTDQIDSTENWVNSKTGAY